MSLTELIFGKRPDRVEYDPTSDDLAKVHPEEAKEAPIHTARCSERELRATLWRYNMTNMLQDIRFDGQQTRRFLIYLIILLFANGVLQIADVLRLFKP